MVTRYFFIVFPVLLLSLNALQKKGCCFFACGMEKAPHRDWFPVIKYLHLFDSATIPLPPTFYDDYRTRTRALLKNQAAANWRKAVCYHYYESVDEHNVAKHIGVRTNNYKLIYFYENKEWELFDL